MTFFIAEVSSNHSSDVKRCLDFVNCAADIGCDAVKFQLFKIDKLFSSEILKESEEHRSRKKWELPIDFIPEISKQCKKREIQFSCTPFYIEAVEELEPYVDFFKIASYELLWDDLLSVCASTEKPIILSTGMATIEEITHAVEVLRNSGCSKPRLLHCTSAYPTPYKEANLSAIETIRKSTGCETGWSDHTVEPAVLHRAIHHWGSKVIEFHLDLDGKGEEFSAGHCWLPEEMALLISDIRKGFDADGDGIKEPVDSEAPDRLWRADPSDGLRPMKEIRNNWK